MNRHGCAENAEDYVAGNTSETAPGQAKHGFRTGKKVIAEIPAVISVLPGTILSGALNSHFPLDVDKGWWDEV
jgi:hypothetical protein